MIDIKIIIAILVIHWIADFLCQTDKMAQGKSKNWSDLLEHTLLYSLIFLIFSLFLFKCDAVSCSLFWLITFICHTVTDYFTSKLIQTLRIIKFLNTLHLTIT